eukprot:Phypoly_transcript_30594.p1 GENE.Phypoly_transcript_30594~~Phypoly_transcript_30594.p1  ORF type:complete len:116 (+),score=9.85 Phypoly_transcript_30594:29-376(+)
MAPAVAGKIILVNSWSNYGGDYEEATYRVVDGVCHLQGLITRSSLPHNSTIGVVPEACKPKGRIILSASNHSYATGTGGTLRVDILPSGELIFVGGNVVNQWISLSGMSYIVSSN